MSIANALHLGLAHWGCVRIVNSVQMDLGNLSALDVIFGSRKNNSEVDKVSTKENNDTKSPSGYGGDLFVALGNGNIFHGSIHADHKPSPKHYKVKIPYVPDFLCQCPCVQKFMAKRIYM